MWHDTTLKEIAEITGYSISTVSKALHDSAEISIKSKAKIRRIAKLLNYHPNKLAISLRSGKNFCIAVIMPSIEDPFYARVFHGIQSEILNTNYSIITCISNELLEEEKCRINKVFDQVDAFIIAVSEETINKNEFKHIESIQKTSKPLVLIDRAIKNMKCCQIYSDSKKDIETITTKVFNDGYKSVALVCSTANVNNGLKIKGFLRVSEKAINKHAQKVILNSNPEQLEQKLIALINNYNVDCIIAIEEETTFNIPKILKKVNKKIPQDIALIGYMSENIAQSLDISISTINQHRKTMGIKAIKMVLKKLENPKLKIDDQFVKINSTLIKRQTYTN